MSHVSNVILMSSPVESGYLPPIGLRRVEDYAGGTKRMENCVYCAGVNYMETEAVVEWFKNHPWTEPACLIIQTEGGPIQTHISSGE